MTAGARIASASEDRKNGGAIHVRPEQAMSNVDTQKLVIMCAIGLVAGWLASLLVGGIGLIGMLISGLVGGVVGGFVFNALNVRLTGNAIVDQIIQAAVGAVIVVLIARVFLR
jgi:uncharacterized membrane protein YeaQ/YmgE (transglycosylase-associated protein family)